MSAARVKAEKMMAKRFFVRQPEPPEFRGG
jgi:hypothetical protein